MGLSERITVPMLTSALAIDCEMVSGRRMKKRRVVPSRVYIVNERGECVYDSYVKCDFEVEFGIDTKSLIAMGQPLKAVRDSVRKIIKKRTLVGSNVKNDLKFIGLTHHYISNGNGYTLSKKVGECKMPVFDADKVTSTMSLYCETVNAVRWSETKELPGRVSLVNEAGDCVYDSYISYDLSIFQITDYKTWVSGLTEDMIYGGQPITKVRKEVADLIRKLIIVGHDVTKDLKALALTHPDWNKMDTAEYEGFKAVVNGGKPSLKLLAKEILNKEIQQGAHDSVEDARVAMKLYQTVGNKWEEGKFRPAKNKRKSKMIATRRAVNEN